MAVLTIGVPSTLRTAFNFMEQAMGFEPMTTTLAKLYSTAELRLRQFIDVFIFS